MIENYIPTGDVLLIDEQSGQLRIWVVADVESLEETRYFVLPTGADIDPKRLVHVGSKIARNGLVWHVFKKNE